MKEVVHIEAQESYAVKILDKSHAENDVEDMVREFQMLRALRHPWTFAACKLGGWKSCSKRAAEYLYTALRWLRLVPRIPRASVLHAAS